MNEVWIQWTCVAHTHTHWTLDCYITRTQSTCTLLSHSYMHGHYMCLALRSHTHTYSTCTYSHTCMDSTHTLLSRSNFSSESWRLDSSLSRERCSDLLLFSSPSSEAWVSCNLSSSDFLSRESWGVIAQGRRSHSTHQTCTLHTTPTYTHTNTHTHTNTPTHTPPPPPPHTHTYPHAHTHTHTQQTHVLLLRCCLHSE